MLSGCRSAVKERPSACLHMVGGNLSKRRDAVWPKSRRPLSHTERYARSLPRYYDAGRGAMMPRPLIAMLLLLLCGGMFPTIAAAEGMRCDSKLVDEGDTMDEVRALCGEPTSVSRRDILRRPAFYRNGRHYAYGSDLVEIPVEYWTYNFGPNRLMRRIRFVDGLVEEIETLDYGYND